jgi:uncharacterized protein
MDEKQIKKLVDNCGLPDTCSNINILDTHISWIILTDKYAFKIKKPVKYPFLDFSTFDERQHYCYRELELNKRLAPEMYLKVIPVREKMIEPEKASDEVIDHAVQMKRMDNSREMGNLLEKNEVSDDDIDRLAKKIAQFHQEAKVIKNVFFVVRFQEMYAEVLNEQDFVVKRIGREWAEKIRQCVEKSNIYLNGHRSFLNDRITSGFRKDLHGDLNSHNIFLYEDPVIFDCIEYNEEFRFIDVLNEIAFLCVDLDFYDEKDLSERFYKKYLEYMRLEDGQNERQLFDYYKSYRAGIRAKVSILREKNRKDKTDEKAIQEIKKYIGLMADYIG